MDEVKALVGGELMHGGDSDVYGTQQHAPLLTVEVLLEELEQEREP